MAKQERLVLVDGSAVFHRGYHAIPHLSNAEGVPTNATYGFTTTVLKMLADLKPKYAIVTWDKSSDTFRKEIYPEYKATRKKQPDDLYAQIPYAREVTEALGLPWIELDGYEADDIIGTLGRQAEQRGLETIIVTGDLDELQLIDKRTKVYTMRRGFTETMIYDLDALKERYGVTPEQFIDLKALKGDASDNIPGVEGVGEKTARDLVTTYGSLDEIYEHLDEIKGKLRERLEEGKETAYLSQKLSRIVVDAPIELELKTAHVGRFDRQHIHDLFRRLEFKTLLARLPSEISSTPTLFDNPEPAEKSRQHLDDVRYSVVADKKELEQLVEKLSAAGEFAFDTETTDVDELKAELVGISISLAEKEAFYVPIGHIDGSQLDREHVLTALKPVLENPGIGKVGHNVKYDYKILKRCGVDLRGIVFDTMVAAFLLNPLGRSQSLDDLAYREFGIEMVPISDLIGKGKNEISFRAVKIEDATLYAGEDSDMAWRIYRRLQPELVRAKLEKLAAETEWPLIPILGDMELAGIELDTKLLSKFNQDVSRSIEKLEQQIWEQAGEEFNISSPAQLADVLFNRLDLNKVGVKKGKTGFSTAAAELEKLRDAHPIIPLISEYRELTKLRSTYIEALPLLVDDNSRIHTRYNQTIAQTGRLSSTDPNLQNIPVRTEIGREIRKAFVAPEGRVLISADYSQFELRIAASLSGDQGMIDAFKQGLDVHQQTAAVMYGIPNDEVTKEQRYNAKTINFGVLYGMSPHGLSVATGMSRDEASAFIERYFSVRRTLKEWIDEQIKAAHKNEFAETIFGRRRPLAEINSNNFIIRQGAERMAINMPIQGTQADLMKMAMIELAPKLPKGAQLLLQIHDELITEVDVGQEKSVGGIMRKEMEHVFDLGVPIVVDISEGRSWGDL